MSNFLVLILGVSISTIGAVVVLIPALTLKRKDPKTRQKIEMETELTKWRLDPYFLGEFWRREFLTQRKYARLCFFLVVIGTALQLIGSV